MAPTEPNSSHLAYVTYISATLGAAGIAALVGFRILIELGFGPHGAVWIRGIPLEYFTLGWFAGLLAILSDGRTRPHGSATVVYVRLFGAVGLGGIAWVVATLAARQQSMSLSWAYWFSWSCISGVFVAATIADGPGARTSFDRAWPDLQRILWRPTTWSAVVLTLLVLFAAPRNPVVPTGGPAFNRWYQRQVRLEVPELWRRSPVTLVEMVDYQCPVCRYAADYYREVIQTARSKYPETFEHVTVDFPLESECNKTQATSLHPAACEAAAVVRAARDSDSGQRDRVVEWLWNHQDELDPATLFDQVAEAFEMDIRHRYHDLLASIREDVALAEQLNVRGTPTYFLNGRRLSLVTSQALQQAISIEAQQVSQQ